MQEINFLKLGGFSPEPSAVQKDDRSKISTEYGWNGWMFQVVTALLLGCHFHHNPLALPGFLTTTMMICSGVTSRLFRSMACAANLQREDLGARTEHVYQVCIRSMEYLYVGTYFHAYSRG